MPYFSKYNPDCTSKYEDPVNMQKIIKKLLKKISRATCPGPAQHRVTCQQIIMYKATRAIQALTFTLKSFLLRILPGLLKFEMTVKSLKEAQISLKTVIQSFSRSMIKILLLDFRNSKWLIQNSSRKFEGSLDFAKNQYTEGLEVADRDFAIRLSKFKIADPIW